MIRAPTSTPPFGGKFAHRFTRYAGIFFDDFASDSAWIRETGTVWLPPIDGVDQLVISGVIRPHSDARGLERSAPSLEVLLDGNPVGSLKAGSAGPWELTIPVAPAPERVQRVLAFRLGGVGLTNALAWLGRVTALPFLQRYRRQNKNRQLRLGCLSTGQGEKIYDFSQRESPFCRAFARKHARLGMNIVGFLTADLGVGESARCMVRAADAAGISAALVPLKLNCKNRLGDMTYGQRLQDDNPHAVNVVHLDPPASRDIDHHHGQAFRKGKYNIAYFAWELPEFPEAWISAFDYFDEVWCPSDFTTGSIALKSPLPVITMPHSIAFVRPAGSKAELRGKFRLPKDRFLFLGLFDLNSYAVRKNPEGAIDAFNRSGLGAANSSLVIKVHNAESNPGEFARLSEAVRGRSDILLLTETLSRSDVYALEAACDCFVSLHRSEGFGLVVAECMYLGMPVIATRWSATAEFLNSDNGCPVRCSPVALTENHGPYLKGSTWAQPDLDHASDWMKRIAGDSALAARLGAAARATIETRFSPAVVGARYRARLEAIACY